jgi:nucleoside-diphosphate-sugar epimerase
MKVFVAGATGAIGRFLLPQLREAGHEVVALTRSPERASLRRGEGAEPVVGDALDRDTVIEVVRDAAPDAVVHQLTAIPAAINPRRFASQFEQTNRLRTEGTHNLLAAAGAVGAERFVAQSVAFLYEPVGDVVKDEDAATYQNPAPEFRDALGALLELERAVGEAGGTVLRYGYFYGPGSAYAGDGSIAEQVRKRRFPIVGDGRGVFSFIHLRDAATATVAALERGGGGVFNIVDDEPAPVREWLPAYAEALGAKPPHRVPRAVARLAAGRHATVIMTAQRGASNARAKEQLGWAPEYASWRQGFREALG